MTALVTTVLAASLLGSLHCAGMCGPFAAFAVGRDGRGRRPGFALLAAYNGGRLATYVVLGFVAGVAGAALDAGGLAFGIQRAALVAAGAGMIAFGLVILLRIAGVPVPPLAPAWLRIPFLKLQAAARRLPPVPRALAIGLVSTLLPCGWLYAFAVTAAGTGSAVLGALVMAVFWVGTLPVMASLGLGLQRAVPALRRRAPVLTALALVVVGLVAILGRAGVVPPSPDHPGSHGHGSAHLVLPPRPDAGP